MEWADSFFFPCGIDNIPNMYVSRQCFSPCNFSDTETSDLGYYIYLLFIGFFTILYIYIYIYLPLKSLSS